MVDRMDGSSQGGDAPGQQGEDFGQQGGDEGDRKSFRTAPFRLGTGLAADRRAQLIRENFHPVGMLSQEDLEGYRIAGWTVVQDFSGDFYVRTGGEESSNPLPSEDPQARVAAEQTVFYQQLVSALRMSKFHCISRGDNAPKLTPNVRNAGGIPLVFNGLPGGLPPELWVKLKKTSEGK
ncbi:MAG: hypothetical protein WCX95_02560 [Candidatus Gracilibacteria bacterium]